MADREGESQITIPEGVKVLVELGHGLVIAKVDISIIKEQDKNAHLMKPEMFRQLSENIKKRGTLESLPLCALTDKVEVISGHHRLRASKEAGLKEIVVLLDISGLSRSQIAAKQLAHNAINGFDDKDMLKEIAKIITDVDDMIESYIGKDVLGEPMAELDRLLSPTLDFDWKQIQFVFLPHQLKNLELLVARTPNNADYVGAAHVEQYEQLIDCLAKYQQFKNIKNLGAALASMVQSANNEMEEAGFDGSEEWVTVNHLFGAAAIPSEVSEKVKQAIDKMKKEGVITDKAKWQALDVLASYYLKEA